MRERPREWRFRSTTPQVCAYRGGAIPIGEVRVVSVRLGRCLEWRLQCAATACVHAHAMIVRLDGTA